MATRSLIEQRNDYALILVSIEDAISQIQVCQRYTEQEADAAFAWVDRNLRVARYKLHKAKTSMEMKISRINRDINKGE